MVFHESRGGADREKDGSTATFTPDGDLPEPPRAPAMGLLWLQCGEAWQVRGSGEGKNGRQERLRERGLGFIQVHWLRLHSACFEQNWMARAVFLDGVVSRV
jgi:hypothetical protein